jgi:hypothetical protein
MGDGPRNDAGLRFAQLDLGMVMKTIFALSLVLAATVPMASARGEPQTTTRPTDCKPTYSLASINSDSLILAASAAPRTREQRREVPRQERPRPVRPCYHLASA